MKEQPQHIGRYSVVKPLSKGGMAELFLAYVDGPGGFRKFVAVKRILEHLREDEDFNTMFLDEARITASLSHSNIAQVFELGESADELYLAMEYIAGLDLSRICSALRKVGTLLPIGFAAKVAHDVCLAVHYAHHFTGPGGQPLPVIHRDLSLRNVMVNFAGNVKVIDFGIAKARGSLSTTKNGSIKGSVAYMSPEQLRAEALDGRSDLFTIGSVLFEMLTGEKAFHAGAEPATILRVLNHDPDPPHVKRPEVPKALSQVVLRALKKNRKERFATGRDMAKAIEEACGDELFDEGSVARWMAEHFAEELEKSRAISALVDARRNAPMRRDSKEITASSANSLTAVQATHVGPGGAPPPSARMPLADATVLVVDDSKLGRALVDTVLRGAGATVVGAVSAEEGLAMLAELKPNVIILDVRLPGMNGFDLCAKLRKRPELHSTAILFLSAACSLEERVKGLGVGGDDFVRKPFEASDLINRIRSHVKRLADEANVP